jgi:predicted transcriptional regulator
MVAPNYSKARSELAKTMGLGQARKGRSRKGAKKASKKAA